MHKPIIIALSTALLLLAAAICLLLTSDIPQDEPGGLTWDVAQGTVIAGSAVPGSNNGELVLDRWGEAALSVSAEPFPARQFPILHLRFGELPDGATLALMWKAHWSGERQPVVRIPARPDRSFWLDLGAYPDWHGKIRNFTVVVLAAPGEHAILQQVELLPPKLSRRIQVLLDQWFTFDPWDHLSINLHSGVLIPGTGLYPVPVLAALLGLSLLVYGCQLLLARGRQRFDWRVPAVLAVLCWGALDLLWQADLWRQLGQTRELFAGRSDPQKLAAGIDAELVGFTDLVEQRLAGPAARVFVASDDDYAGMRSAYYLYPANTFWRRGGPELPAATFLHRGDYIATVAPTALQFDPGRRVLVTPDAATVPVERLFASATGSLYRVR